MPSVIEFRRHAQPKRACCSCRAPLPQNFPKHWVYCSRCFGYAAHRRDVVRMLRLPT